jgi:hypothetical protein
MLFPSGVRVEGINGRRDISIKAGWVTVPRRINIGITEGLPNSGRKQYMLKMWVSQKGSQGKWRLEFSGTLGSTT